tara:strand:+ start:2399 stop:3181 length:783 start_codon:yes stop_codon:yes gene_type:complete
MKNYNDIFKKVSKKNKEIYTIYNDPISQVLLCRLSNIITPILIILKFTPNFITFINFVLAALMGFFIILGVGNFFYVGIGCYFFYRVLDFCDGSVARYHKSSTFFGRYIDGLVDIFRDSFLLLSLSIFSLNFLDSQNLFYLGITAALLTIADNLILDRYASLIRWSNQENNTRMKPYIVRSSSFQFTKIYCDIYSIALAMLFLIDSESNGFIYTMTVIFVLFIISFLRTFLIHLYQAHISLSGGAKVKNSAKELKKRKKN